MSWDSWVAILQEYGVKRESLSLSDTENQLWVSLVHNSIEWSAFCCLSENRMNHLYRKITLSWAHVFSDVTFNIKKDIFDLPRNRIKRKDRQYKEIQTLQRTGRELRIPNIIFMMSTMLPTKQNKTTIQENMTYS